LVAAAVVRATVRGNAPRKFGRIGAESIGSIDGVAHARSLIMRSVLAAWYDGIVFKRKEPEAKSWVADG
jgi:hypothetical protein